MSTDNSIKLFPSGNTNILTYGDIQTRALNSIRIGTYSGRNLKFKNNVFIGDKSGLNSYEVEDSVFLGYNAGANIINGNRTIIIGYNLNNDENLLNNSITIGDNYTSSYSTSIGYNNYNKGLSNAIIGYYSSNIGTNLFTIGNNLIVKSLDTFYDNLLNTPDISDYSTIYSNIYNSKTIGFAPIINSNININKKNLITDFIQPFLHKDCLIIQGNINLIYNEINEIYSINIKQSSFTSNLTINQIYNLTNDNLQVTIPISYIRRISKPILDISTYLISFDINDGLIPTFGNYQIKYIISTPPNYGSFVNNIINQISFDSDNLIYIYNSAFLFTNDACGITPYIIINNEFIKGEEVFLNFIRINDNNNDLLPNPIIIPDFAKEIKFKSKIITIDCISFDFIYIKNKIIENLLIDNSYNQNKIFVNFYQKPLYGFITNNNRNPVGSINLSDLSDIIYQNYDNTTNIDTFKVNFSYGYYFANKPEEDLIININIISSYQISYTDQFIFDDSPINNNIINYNLPIYVIDSSLIPLKDYYNYHLNKLNGINEINLNLKLIVFNNSNGLLFDNSHFYNNFNGINFNIYFNNLISSNYLYNTQSDYQYIKYELNQPLKLNKTTINFNILPKVQFNYSYIPNIYNFSLSFYNDNYKITSFNYSHLDDIKLDFNIFTKISHSISDEFLINTNNIRLEYYLSSNISTDNDNKLINNITEIYFRDFSISYDNYDINNFGITMGNDITIDGLNNIAIGSNFSIIGNNSIVVGANNSKNPIYESIIIGNNNFTDNYANKAIIIGNNNTTQISASNQIIIGNNINNRFLLNIDNLLCRDENAIYLGISSIPVVIGYDSNEIIDFSSSNSLYIKNGINTSNISIANNNNNKITLAVSESLTGDITYVLPSIPTEVSRLMMTSDKNGIMSWIETDVFNATCNINLNKISCSNIIVSGIISGDGSEIKNLNINDKSTDDLKEGITNLYFTPTRTSNVITDVLSKINSDYIKEGLSNLYYTNERDSNAFILNFSKITTDDINEGSNNLYFSSNYLSNAIKTVFNNFTTDDLKNGNSNLYLNQENINKLLLSKTTDDFTEGTSNLFFTNQRANSNISRYLNSITTDHLKEGSSNLYYNLNRLNKDVNIILTTKTTNDLKEGSINKYFNTSNVSNILSNLINLRTTDEIKEGISNLYLTSNRFNQFLKTKTTNDIIEGTNNFYLTSNRVLGIINGITTDFISEGTSNLYYNEKTASNYFFKAISQISTDNIIEGSNNKFITNGIFNSNLTINGNINASNILFDGLNIKDVYYESLSNLQSNYAKTYINESLANDINITGISNQSLKMILNLKQNQSLNLMNGTCPFIIVGSNVGINLLNPSYNLHVNGIAYANYFQGDGSGITNLNFNNMPNFNTDAIPIGTSNKFIENNIYKNNLTILGDLIYNNSIIKGDIIPFSDNYYKLGNSTSYFNNIYSSKITLGSSFNNSNLIIDFNNNKLNFSNNNSSNLKIIDFNYLYNLPDFRIGTELYISNLVINNSNNSNPILIKDTNKTLFLINSNGDLFTSGDLFIKDINISNLLFNSSNDLWKYTNKTSNDFININSNNSNDLWKYTNKTSNDFININSNNSNNLWKYTNITSNDFININSNNSNYFINKLNNINSDTIIIGSSNKFITNDIYNNNLTINGTLTTNNLNVIGNYTIIETDIYRTEKLEIINESTATSLITKQMNLNQNLIELYNSNNLSFLINSNGNVGIGLPYLNNKYKLDVNGTINCSDIYINNLNFSNILIDLINTSSSIITSNSNYFNSEILSLSNITSNNSNDLWTYTTKTSNNLINVNYNNSNLITSIIGIYNSNFSNIYNNLNYIDIFTNNIRFFIDITNTNTINFHKSLSNLNEDLFYNISNNYNNSNDLWKYTNITSNNLIDINSNNSIYLNKKIEAINTDTIIIGSSNKFITNDIYNNNLTINGTLTTNNLNVIGNYTIIQTDIYRTEKLEIINDSTATSLITKQMNLNQNLIELYNSNNLSFLINSNGNVGIGLPYLNDNYKLDVNGTINCSDIYINNLNFSNVLINLIDTSSSIITANSNYFNSEILSLSNITSNNSNDLWKYTNITSNNLIDVNSNNSNDLWKYTNITSNNLIDVNSNNSNDLWKYTNITSNNLIDVNSNNSNDLWKYTNITSNNLIDVNSNNSNDLWKYTNITSNNLIDINSNNSNDLWKYTNITSNNLIDVNSNNSNDLWKYTNITSNNLIDVNSNNSNDLWKYTNITSNNLIDINSNNSNDLWKYTNITSNNLIDINSNNSNDLWKYTNITSNNLIDVNSNNSNDLWKYTNITSNNLIDINSNNSNDLWKYTNITSNNLIDVNSTMFIFFNNKIDAINTDTIPIGINNKFIINNIYDNNLKINGNLECSNLFINNFNFNNFIINFIDTYNSNNQIINDYLFNYSTSNSNKLLINDLNFEINSNNLWNYTNITSNNLIDVNSNNSNYFNNRLNNINTDTIIIGSSNKFITNDIYNNNLTINGTLTTDNLNVIGNFTTIETDIYRTEKLEIINESTATSLITKQMNLNQNLIELYNSNNLSFLINSNGNVGIGLPYLNNNYKLDVNGTINCSDIYINNLNFSNVLINLIDTSSSIITSNSNYFNSEILSLSNITSNNSNNLWNYTNITSNNLIYINSNNSNNFNNRLNNINSDTIIIGTSNKFITNDIYNNNLTINGTLTTDNLNVIGNFTTIETDIYRTEKLEIINESTATSLIIKQMNLNQNLIELYNSNNLSFLINSNCNVGIGLSYLNDNYKLDVNGTINCSDIYINNLNFSNVLINLIDTSSSIITSNSNYFNSEILLLSNITSNNSNNLWNYTNITSNDLDTKINYINTDTIPLGYNNRFIVNNKYDSNLTINGTLTTNNLTVLGECNLIIKDTFRSENLQITNVSDVTSFIVNQMNNNYNLIELYNSNDLTFLINSNGNIGIGNKIITDNYKLDVNGSINCTDLYINDINITCNLSNINYYSTYAYNSTVVDFTSITTNEIYIVNSSNYTDTHYCTYIKNIYDSELLIQADFPYKINGFGSDHYASRIAITSEIINIPEYSIEHEQIFIGYAAGGGTRSTTLSPITHKTGIEGSAITIKIQLKLIDSDDSIYTDKCVFIITEKKPSYKLILTDYITPEDVVTITNDLYVHPDEFNDTINNLNIDNIYNGNYNRFLVNDIYNRPSATFTGSINILGETNDTTAMILNQMNLNQNLVEFYKQHNLKFIIDKNGNVGINVIEPEYNLDIGGDINCSNIYINDENLLTIVDTNLNNTSNDLYDYTTWNFERARNFNTFAYNSTLVDFSSIITTESYVINSSNYTDTHYCVYYKNLFDSELLIQADFPYTINGYGSDHYSSRIAVISEANIEPEYSIEHEQIFIGYAAGGGTRSTTLSPINHKTSILGNVVTIKVQLRAIDSDDSILTDKCVFIITEKKPTSKLVLTRYITPTDVIELTSNLYLTTPELNDILVNYQTNDYGKWESNTNQSIYFNVANVGIGISNPNINYNLDVSGIINADNFYLNNINILDTIDSRIDYQSNILDDKIILNVNQLNSKINSLNSDYIYNGNINRFIVNDIYDRDIYFKTNVFASNIITCNLSVIGENTTFLTSIYQTEQLEIVNDTTSTSLIIKQMTPLQNVAEFYNGENLSLLIDSNGNIDINGSVNCSSLYINQINLIDNFNENIYLTSNDLINFTNETFSRLQNSNLVGFNSTLVDFKSIITSNVFIINSSNYTNTHTCTYHKFFPDSEVLIQADFPYKINGFGSDHYSSRIKITSELNQTPEYSVEHEQIFIGYAAGGGTRSATLSPLSHKTDIQGLFINITVQMRLIDSDDSIYSDKCVFIITEKKPSSRLIFSHYLSEGDIPRLTSNLYISPDELSETLLSYESNIYGKWTSNINSRDIYYEALDANIGIGTSNPSFKLDVNGYLNCSELFRNGISLDNALDYYINEDELNSREYVNSNNIRNYINSNIIGYNTTLVDFSSIISSNTYIVNTSNYMDTHHSSYQKFFDDSELLIQAEFPYKINGFGSDHYVSRLEITSTDEENPEYSFEYEQIFIGYAAGGGTRSTTLSPINHKTNIKGKNINIKVQIKLIDSDDSLITDKCNFIITEKKPSSTLYFTNYINEQDIPKLTSNLYVSHQKLDLTLQSYQTNNYGKWNCNNNAIYYNDGNVGIGKTNPQDKLDVNGNIISSGEIISSFSDIRLKTIIEPITNALDVIANLNGFKYKANDIAKNFGYNDDRIHIGVNAQEVFNYIPEIVSIAPFDIKTDDLGNITSKSGNNYLTLQYEKLIPYLIEGMKELKKENEKLLNKIKVLENIIFKK